MQVTKWPGAELEKAPMKEMTKSRWGMATASKTATDRGVNKVTKWPTCNFGSRITRLNNHSLVTHDMFCILTVTYTKHTDGSLLF